METSDQNEDSKKKTKLYFGIAIGFIFLLAMFWSVDASLTYFFLGGCAFFLFLGFRTIPFRISRDNGARESSYRRPAAPERERPTQPGSAPQAAMPPRAKIARFVAIFFGVFVFLFVGGILLVIFSGPDISAESWFYEQQGNTFYEQGQYDSALLSYRAAFKADPESATAMTGYGKSFAALQQNDSAMVMYNLALEKDPEQEEATYRKAWVYFDNKDYARTAELLNAVIEKNPGHSEAIQLMGSVYYSQNEYPEAIKWFERAYGNGLRSAWLSYVMAYLYDKQGDTAKAIEFYKESLNQDDATTDIYIRLGELLSGEEGNYYRTEAAKRQQSN